MHNKINHVSKFGMISSLLFIAFSFLGRILYPFGDEPDFSIRAPTLVNIDHNWWSPYSILSNFIQDLQSVSPCQIDASATSLWAGIDSLSCTENLEQILVRFFITIIIVSPLLYAITFRKPFVYFMKIFGSNLSNLAWNKRLDILSLTLLFPSIIYYLGILAEEQFVLILSLLIFLFWGFRIIILILLVLVVSIDMGNSIIILTFIVFGLFFNYMSKKYTIKSTYLVMSGVIIFAASMGHSFLPYLENISFLASKATSMYTKSLGFEDKYPILLRPIITFMTGVFMMPSGVKVVMLYPLYGYLLIVMYLRLKSFKKKIFKVKDIKVKKKFTNEYIVYLTSFVTILFFVFLFPDYSFAKYYVFLIPFILSVSLYVFDKKNIIKFFIATNIIIFVHLLLYRV